MLVKDIMSHPVILVNTETSVKEALEILRKSRFHHLPVVDAKGILNGVVTEKDLLSIFPKTQKSNFEINLLSRTPVSNLMGKNPITIEPDKTIEDAALIMQNNNIGCLPVVENNRVIGLLTETDVINCFIDSMGFGSVGLRMTIKIDKVMGFLAKLIAVIDEHHAIIKNIVAFEKEILLKVCTTKPNQILKDLKNRGYNITHFTITNDCEVCNKEELPKAQ